jgi:hypothetical protein
MFNHFPSIFPAFSQHFPSFFHHFPIFSPLSDHRARHKRSTTPAMVRPARPLR